jgi:hypothetical protein
MQEIKKIRINSNNEWYLKTYLSLLVDYFPAKTFDFRTLLLKILYQNTELVKNKSEEEIIKLNDTLYTYCSQFCYNFHLSENRLSNYVLANNFTRLYTATFNEKENNLKLLLQKIMMFSEKENKWNILSFLSNKERYQYKSLIEVVLNKLDLPDTSLKKKHQHAIDSLLQLYIMNDLLHTDDIHVFLNKDLIERLQKTNLWIIRSELEKQFNWEVLINSYQRLSSKLKNKRIPLYILLADLSQSINTPVQNLIFLVQGIPVEIGKYKIYLIQGRRTMSSIKIANTLYDSIEISKN